jgi:hypothetical protein
LHKSLSSNHILPKKKKKKKEGKNIGEGAKAGKK